MKQQRRTGEQKRLRKDSLSTLEVLKDEESAALLMDFGERALYSKSNLTKIKKNGDEVVTPDIYENFKGMIEAEDISSMTEEVKYAFLCAVADSLQFVNRFSSCVEGFATDCLVYETYLKLSALGVKLKNPNEKFQKGRTFVDFVECIRNRFNPSEPDYKILKILAEASDKGEMMCTSQVAQQAGLELRGSNIVLGRFKSIARILKIYGIDITYERSTKRKGEFDNYPMFYKFVRLKT